MMIALGEDLPIKAIYTITKTTNQDSFINFLRHFKNNLPPDREIGDIRLVLDNVNPRLR